MVCSEIFAVVRSRKVCRTQSETGWPELAGGQCRYKWLSHWRSAARLSQKVAKINGIDICDQRARQFVKEDLIVTIRYIAMAEDVDRMICEHTEKNSTRKNFFILNELYPGRNMDVPDPWYGPEPGYHEVYELIDAACKL